MLRLPQGKYNKSVLSILKLLTGRRELTRLKEARLGGKEARGGTEISSEG